MLFGYGWVIELRHLRYFVTVADEENVSRAAARLRISQPAVSRQIKDLEDELGVALFDRSPSGLKLTAAGSAFLAHARDLLRRANAAVEEVRSMQRPAAQPLVIGAITPVLTGTLTAALRKFSELRPDVQVRIVEQPPRDQVHTLRAGKLDAALIGQPCKALGREFEIVTLRRMPLRVILSDHHLLASRKKLRLAELSGETFVGLDDELYPTRTETVCQICQAAGFTPRFTETASSLAVLFALVAAGKGVALVPAEATEMPHPQTRFIALAPPVPEVFSAALVRPGTMSPALKELLDCCRAVPRGWT